MKKMMLIVALMATAAVVAAGAPSDASAADTCPNAGLRTVLSAKLPDCRAYELVSPTDKNTSDVASTASRTQSALDGDSVTYISSGAFPGSAGTTNVGQYLAARGSDGWKTEPITPRQQTDEFSFIKNGTFRMFAPDLSKTIFVGGEPSLSPEAPEGVRNLYVRNNQTGQFSVVTTVAPNNGLGVLTEPHFAATTGDFGHVLFESSATLTSNAPDDGTTKLYESIAGQIRLAGILPNGDPASGGSFAGVGAGAGNFQSADTYTARTLSADGSRVIFTEAATGQLFSRADGASTVQVSRSQASTADPDGPLPATYRGASADGTKILFTSCEKLTDDSTASAAGCDSEGGSADLYQYDTDTGGLTVLSTDSEPSDGLEGRVRGIIGESADGSYVYFVSDRRLTPDASTAATANLYLWHAGAVRFVATFGGEDDGNRDVWNVSFQTGLSARVAADGRHALFASFGEQAGVDSGGKRQIYFYDEPTASLRCLSCLPGGGPGAGEAIISQVAPGVPAGKNEYRNRALLEDGSKAFFATTAPLVADDSNGRYDVYEWDALTGKVAMLSTGRGNSDAYFVDASADGRDVFFTTRERLSGHDTDDSVDLYDARANGGLPEPLPETTFPCSGDECQGVAAVPLGQPHAGTTVDIGAGDGSPPSRPASPTLRIAKPSASTLRSAGRSGSLRVRVTVAGKGTLSTRLSGKLTARTTTLASARTAVAAAGKAKTVTVTLRLSTAARKRLAEKGRLRATLTVSFPRAASHSTTFTLMRKHG